MWVLLKMAEYYISSSNLTFSLYEDRILWNEGSGSSASVRKECTRYWLENNNNVKMDLFKMIEVSNQVSGSPNYIFDKMGYK